MRWAENVARRGEKRTVYMILVGEPEGKRPPGKQSTWVDNIKMDQRDKIGRYGVD
jgi:hypothetical protein